MNALLVGIGYNEVKKIKHNPNIINVMLPHSKNDRIKEVRVISFIRTNEIVKVDGKKCVIFATKDFIRVQSFTDRTVNILNVDFLPLFLNNNIEM